jgi:AraC family transcriptional regulator of adaptative response/methylated-DNA-[protein]-cysteine methyltransferase
MKTQAQIDYQRIERAIAFITENFADQPSLGEIAAAVHISPFHFQRLFSKWAGVSPKQFMRFLALEHAKDAIRNHQATILDAAFDAGLSGPSRLHDLFVTIEGMTPGQFKQGGSGLAINYSYADTLFGPVVLGATPIGLCHMAFEDAPDKGIATLRQKFPNASFAKMFDKHQADAIAILNHHWQHPSEHRSAECEKPLASKKKTIRLHLNGSAFQLKIWEALLKIPMGSLATYGDIATHVDAPHSARAVGTAIARNPIALLIPCHRVIRKTGNIGGYMWGPNRKQAIIAWEASQYYG